MRLPTFLSIFTTLLLLPVAHSDPAATIKIGVLLPWDGPGGWVDEIMAAMDWTLYNYNNSIDPAEVGFELVFSNIDDGTAATAIVKAYELVFDQNVNAVIGTDTSSQTALAALIASKAGIPICDGLSTAVTLSDKSEYPTFFRTTVSDAADALALPQFIVAQGWKQVAILAATSTYGLALSQTFVAEAVENDIKILSVQLFNEGCSHSAWEPLIAAIKKSGATIIVYIGGGEDYLAATLVAERMGIFNERYAWIASGYVVELDWLGLDPVDTQRLDGTFMPYPYEGPADSLYPEWAQNFTDAVEFSGGEKPTDNAAYYSLCVQLLVEGWTNLISSDTSFTWSDLAANNLTANYTYTCDGTIPDCIPTFLISKQNSISGLLEMDPATGDRVRQPYMWYQIRGGVVYAPENVVGTYENGVTNLDHAKIVYINNSPAKPDDRIFSRIDYNTPGAYGVIAVAGLMAFITILMMIIYYIFRNEKVIKASSVLFCELIMVGIVLGYSSVFTFLGDPTQPGLCIGQIWTLGVAFILVFGNLVAKTGRIFLIFNRAASSSRTTVAITDAELLRPSGGLLAVQVLILAIWTGIDQPRLYIDFMNNARYCRSSSYTFAWIIFAYDGLVMLAGVFFALQTRSVAKRFRDSASIGLTIYTITLILSVLLPIFTALPDPRMAWIALMVCILLSLTAMLAFLFVPKLFLLYRVKFHPADKTQPTKTANMVNAMLETNNRLGRGHGMSAVNTKSIVRRPSEMGEKPKGYGGAWSFIRGALVPSLNDSSGRASITSGTGVGSGGTGGASGPSSSVVITSLPMSPGGVSVTPGDTSV